LIVYISLKGKKVYARPIYPEGAMARAKLFHIPGFIWHLTHRCHNKNHLLKFKRDKMRWLHWIFQAKRKYGLEILDYVVTSNHIHLLVLDGGSKETIPRSILLAASRTALEYNFRKTRSGAFWEDSYHATAVATGLHFQRCLTYIDLNMVRAGVVNHPRDWPYGGFAELWSRARRFRLVDLPKLQTILGFDNPEDLKSAREAWVHEALEARRLEREAKWSDSIAVGDEEFVKAMQDKLGPRARFRRIIEEEESCSIRDPSAGRYAHYLDYRPKARRPDGGGALE